ncbi:LysR family transcriptional regulator [Streptomyces sp. NPDC059697]|uniref:LysR family transcriptional regulator n=1 Tax=Streptomyces sp. NPDC059697 TaxID=3346912 RepID=UPI0036D013F6
MDRRNLQSFETVARLGSVSAAAAELRVSQPAVSKQIQRLEKELGLHLFHRNPSGMTLTAAGETLLELGFDVLARFERAEGVMRSRFRGMPSFRVACPHATAEGVLTPFVAMTDVPIVDLHIIPADDVDAALDHNIDLAVSSLPPPEHRHRLPIAEVPVMVQGTAEAHDRFGVAQSGDLELLRQTWLIVPRTGVGTAVIAAAATLDPAPSIREVSAGSVAQSLAANGQGFALVTEAQRFGLGAVPGRVNGQPITITLYASWDVNHYAATDLLQMAKSLREWMSANPPWGPREAWDASSRN